MRSPMSLFTTRASPNPQRPDDDRASQVATVGDIDDLGSVASLTSITDAKMFEVSLTVVAIAVIFQKFEKKIFF